MSGKGTGEEKKNIAAKTTPDPPKIAQGNPKLAAGVGEGGAGRLRNPPKGF